MADLKLDTLIKVLGMTTSTTDGEALAAIRRANVMLKNAGVNWDSLLRSKVTVIADPFTDIAPPTPHRDSGIYRPVNVPTTPPPPRASPSYVRPVRPTIRPTTAGPFSSPRAARANNTNTFAGYCFCCNAHVPAAMGAIRDIAGMTKIFCEQCNFDLANGNISSVDALKRNAARQQSSSPQPRHKRKVTTQNLMDGIDLDP